ncbi:ficolin-2-like [Clytia hemisphaerica]|uniref:Fibrinogen C-terminal domain-containing protein n=1 Tax=Clytia hemisphaerica TaxID=252671 RepID=A0A7M5TUG2_9CNID
MFSARIQMDMHKVIICSLMVSLIINGNLAQEMQLNSHFRLEKENYIIKNGSHIPSEEFVIKGSEIECLLKCQLNYLACFTLEILKLGLTSWLCRFYNVDFMKLSYESKEGSMVYSTTARSCLEWLERGFTLDGVYKILTVGEEKEVFCDMTGGGWTMIQRRLNGDIDFNRGWQSYKEGFGDVNGDFWIGLETIREMSVLLNNTLIRIQGESFNEDRRFIIAKGFYIEDEQKKYKLHAGTMINDEWDIGHDWTYHGGSMFTTRDDDNDKKGGSNCAQKYPCAWWYVNCYALNANRAPAKQQQTTYADGISWPAWLGDFQSLKTINMAIKKMN